MRVGQGLIIFTPRSRLTSTFAMADHGASREESAKPTKDDARPQRLGHYILLRTLGKGSFGKVKLAQHEITKHTVAVKILNKAKIEQQKMDAKINREIKILKLLQHPHVIRLYEVIDTPTDIFLVMEYVSEGELFYYIVRHWPLPLEQVRKFFQQIIAGVEYIHYYRVVHRDLKPENVLLDKDLNLKIADFGFSNLMQDGDFLRTSCGSPNYASPEIISGQLYAGPEVDVWGCGVILYAMLCGRLPFDEEHISALFRKIKDGDYELPECLPEDCKDLIRRMLAVNPLERITISGIRNHKFFQENLPPYLALPPEQQLHKGREMVDQEVLMSVAERMDIPYEIALKTLISGSQTPVSVAYWILIHAKKTRLDNPTPVACEPNMSDRAISKLNPLQPSPVMEGLWNTQHGLIQYAREHYNQLQEPDVSANQGGYLYNYPVHKNWRLGLYVQLRCNAAMQQVYQALKVLELKWHIVGPFRLICKWLDGRGKQPVAMGVQIYRMSDNPRKGYLIDFSVVGPETVPTIQVINKMHTILTDMQRAA